MADYILQLDSLETFIGQYHILFGIDIKVERGKATVLLGRNGAGKTTTIDSIMGLRMPTSGKIDFDGVDITKMHPHERAKLGMGYVPENRDIFSNLTVEENFRISLRTKKKEVFNERIEKIFEIFPDMKKYYKSKSGVLSGGQAQMLAIARAIVNDNKLILIDEPSKGLAPILIEQLIKQINEIKQKNTILMVEQNYHMATEIGDYFYFIEDGKTVFSCTKEELLKDDTIKQKYLGI